MDEANHVRRTVSVWCGTWKHLQDCRWSIGKCVGLTNPPYLRIRLQETNILQPLPAPTCASTFTGEPGPTLATNREILAFHGSDALPSPTNPKPPMYISTCSTSSCASYPFKIPQFQARFQKTVSFTCVQKSCCNKKDWDFTTGSPWLLTCLLVARSVPEWDQLPGSTGSVPFHWKH